MDNEDQTSIAPKPFMPNPHQDPDSPDFSPEEVETESLRHIISRLESEIKASRDREKEWEEKFLSVRKDAVDRMEIIEVLRQSKELQIGRIILNPIRKCGKAVTFLPYTLQTLATLSVISLRNPISITKNITSRNCIILFKALLKREPTATIRENFLKLLSNKTKRINNNAYRDENHLLHIDYCHIVNNHLEMQGWLISSYQDFEAELFHNGTKVGRLTLDFPRPGVLTKYRHLNIKYRPGFKFHGNLKSPQKTDQLYITLSSSQKSRKFNIDFLCENTTDQYTKLRIKNNLSSSVQPISAVHNISCTVLLENHSKSLVSIERSIRSTLEQIGSSSKVIILNYRDNPAVIGLLSNLEHPKIEVKHLFTRISPEHYINWINREKLNDYILLTTTECELSTIFFSTISSHLNSIAKDKEPDVIYFDEDFFDKNFNHTQPVFKPRLNPDYLLSANYIGSNFLIAKNHFLKSGGFHNLSKNEYKYDFLLRSLEKDASFLHIPMVLIHNHYRKDYSSFYQPGETALKEYLSRNNIEAIIEPGIIKSTYRIRRRIDHFPKTTILIPTKDNFDVLKKCIDSIVAKTTYPNYEILIINNCSKEESALKYYEKISKSNRRIRCIDYNFEFNYSAINNWAVNQVDSEYILLLNDDTEVISKGWLGSMIELIQRPKTAAVGAKLLYHDNTIQHAGVILNMGGLAGHAHKHCSDNEDGYLGRINIIQNFNVCTAACLLVKKSVFQEVRGFDAKNLKVAFNDVDLCLKIVKAGYQITYSPYAKLYHYESKSRGKDRMPEQLKRARKEKTFIRKKWRNVLKKGDESYNPNLSLSRHDFSLNI